MRASLALGFLLPWVLGHPEPTYGNKPVIKGNTATYARYFLRDTTNDSLVTTLYGRILDASTNKPLPGVSITMLTHGDLQLMGITNTAGRYEVSLPDTVNATQCLIKIRMLGYSAAWDTIPQAATHTLKRDYSLSPIDSLSDIIICTLSKEKWFYHYAVNSGRK